MSIEDLPGGIEITLDLDLAPSANPVEEIAQGDSSCLPEGGSGPRGGPRRATFNRDKYPYGISYPRVSATSGLMRFGSRRPIASAAM
jgi:hypothetical protein